MNSRWRMGTDPLGGQKRRCVQEQLQVKVPNRNYPEGSAEDTGPDFPRKTGSEPVFRSWLCYRLILRLWASHFSGTLGLCISKLRPLSPVIANVPHVSVHSAAPSTMSSSVGDPAGNGAVP